MQQLDNCFHIARRIVTVPPGKALSGVVAARFRLVYHSAFGYGGLQRRFNDEAWLSDRHGRRFVSGQATDTRLRLFHSAVARKNIPFRLLTNNSQRTRRDVVTKLGDWASTWKKSTSSPALWRPRDSLPIKSPAAPRSSLAKAACYGAAHQRLPDRGPRSGLRRGRRGPHVQPGAGRRGRANDSSRGQARSPRTSIPTARSKTACGPAAGRWSPCSKRPPA